MGILVNNINTSYFNKKLQLYFSIMEKNEIKKLYISKNLQLFMQELMRLIDTMKQIS